jgi:hypothetical protein
VWSEHPLSRHPIHKRHAGVRSIPHPKQDFADALQMLGINVPQKKRPKIPKKHEKNHFFIVFLRLIKAKRIPNRMYIGARENYFPKKTGRS